MKAADELPGRASREDEREGEAHVLHRESLPDHQERHQQQEAGARRRVDDRDRAEPGEAPGIDHAPARRRIRIRGRCRGRLLRCRPSERQVHAECDGRHRDAARRRRRSPPDDADPDREQRGNDGLARVTGEVVDAERRAHVSTAECPAHEARSKRVLHARPEPRDHERHEQRPESVCLGQQQPADRHAQRAEREQSALSEPFGDEPGGELARRHCAVEHALQDSDLGQRQSECLRPEWQERKRRLRQAVVGRMDGRARREDGTRRTAT